MNKEIAPTVDAYIAAFPPEIRERMETLRTTILGTTPGIQEKISWGMATFFTGKRRMHFAGHKHHIGLYPGTEAIVAFADELRGFKTSKGGIQLPHSAPLPMDLVALLADFALAGKFFAK